MKIGFFGTPELASCCLNDLLEEHEIIFVVSTEDKPCGRNRKLKFCPTKDLALCRDIEVLQPVSLTGPEFIQKLEEYNADIFIVVAYGRLIPVEVFNLPEFKTINLHPSLLPKYRGAAPIEWALINGEKEAGITVQMINEGLDSGDIIVQKKFSIDINMTSEDIYGIVKKESCMLLNKAIDILVNKLPVPVKQDESSATYCRKINKVTAHINWNKNPIDIHNQVRGLNPKPVAWSTFRDKNIKIWKTFLPGEDTGEDLKPGRLLKYKKKRLFVGSGNGNLEVLMLQPENKKIMDAGSFINGYRLEPGDCLI